MATETSSYMKGKCWKCVWPPRKVRGVSLKPVSMGPWDEKWVKQVMLWTICQTANASWGARCRFPLSSGMGENHRVFPRGRSMDARAGSALAAAASPHSPFSLHLTFELSLIQIWGKLCPPQLRAHPLPLPSSIVKKRQKSNSKTFYFRRWSLAKSDTVLP